MLKCVTHITSRIPGTWCTNKTDNKGGKNGERGDKLVNLQKYLTLESTMESMSV